MIHPFVLPLSQCTDPLLVGGKAMGIARLLSADMPVPDGCCITTAAYEQSLQNSGFASRERWGLALAQRGDKRRQALLDCRKIIEKLHVSSLVEAVEQHMQQLASGRGKRWALRSSASNEDMSHASGAGLYRTVLDVRREHLGQGIVEVWASLWDERVMEYMVRWSSIDEPPAMAIVIQPLLNAVIAGVAHSIHPVTGRDIHVTINAIRGLGQPLVDGTVTPDHYVVETTAGPPGRVIRRMKGQQDERLIAIPRGLVTEPIPFAERNQLVLSDHQLVAIATLTKRIEQVFHGPVDVEWAIEKEDLWVLQARPVTAVPPTADPMNADSEWSRANFKETMPELPSPMALSFLELFMDQYILSQYRRLGCRIPDGLTSVRTYFGRPYLNVTLFHMLVGQLGGDPLLNGEQIGGDPLESPPIVQPLRWPLLLRAAWLMWREMRRAFMRSAAVFVEMKDLASRYGTERVRQWSLTEVSARLDELGRWLESREMTFGIAAGAGQCLQAFSRLLPRWLGSDWRRLLNDSLRGQGTVISAAQILRIADLTRLAREDVGVSHALRHGWEAGNYRRSFEGSRFLSAFDRYLSDFGHRAVGESDVMSPRLADEPETLLQVIKTQLNALPITSEELMGRQREARDQALATIKARLGWRLDRWLLFRWWYRRLCGYFALREANRHHLMWYSLAARNLLLRLGELLVDRGIFTLKEDIFFLTLREREILDKAPADTWRTLIKVRRAERAHWKTVNVPDTIRGWENPQVESHPPWSDGDRLLQGVPISSGIVSGPVRFVRATSDWCRVRSGDIVVAPVIDPGMAPLFGVVGGLIVEMGGSLSHGAIIAREYGLPAIANVTRAMSRLSEDEYVTVDAGQGLVRRHIAGP